MKKYRETKRTSVVEEPGVAYNTTPLPSKVLLTYKNMIEDDHHLIQFANKGDSANAINDFSKLSRKTKEEMGGWIYFTPKTIRNYEAEEKKLPTLQSGLLLKLYTL